MLHQQTFNFLKCLGENNTREWADANRDEMNDAKSDVTAFAALIVSEICKFDPVIAKDPPEPRKCVTRLNRDMRFGKGKGPYKTDFYIVVGLQGIQGLAASYAVHVEPGNCFAGGGAPNPMGPDLLAYRKKVSAGFDDFSTIVETNAFKDLFPHGITSQSGNVRKRVPRDFDASDPSVEFLKMEGFITREHLPNQALMTAKELDKIIRLLKGSKPLIDFLNR